MVYILLICWLLASCSLVYYAVCLKAAVNFRKGVMNHGTAMLPVSILKPLKGCDPQMYESLRSHCTQDYPEFEIIFGVNDAVDEAIPLVDRLKSEFPTIPIRTVVSLGTLGANGKVSNLIQMLRVAEHEHVLINDGDIRVPPGYLQDVMGAFTWPGEKKVGMVTCLYRGVCGRTVWSKLEAIGINTDFMAGVLTAILIERDIRFALGSTMATTKEAIASIGGLETVVDYLADDYELGRRIADAGYRVAISKTIVETFLPDYKFKQFIEHQLRWGRTVRSSRPGGYFGMGATFGMFWALLAVIASGSAIWAWALLAVVILAKAGVTLVIGKRAIGDPRAVQRLWLLPLRELITPAIWLMSLFGNSVVWRGERFTLHKGKLLP